MNVTTLGILAGWRRRRAEHCEILTLQLIESGSTEISAKVVVALSDEQLCSMARDMTRAAVGRGLVVWPNGVPAAARRSTLDRLLDRALGRATGRPPGRRPAMLRLQDMRQPDALN